MAAWCEKAPPATLERGCAPAGGEYVPPGERVMNSTTPLRAQTMTAVPSGRSATSGLFAPDCESVSAAGKLPVVELTAIFTIPPSVHATNACPALSIATPSLNDALTPVAETGVVALYGPPRGR